MKTIILGLLLALTTSLGYAQSNYQLSSHVLDVTTGLPAQQIPIKLERLEEQSGKWVMVDEKKTDENGRISNFLPKNTNTKGIYRLTFIVADYFSSKKIESFYPFIEVVFQIKDDKHYHVPITLSPFGYSTYRGN